MEMMKYIMKTANDQEEACKILEDMDIQGYEPLSWQYQLVCSGSDCYEGIAILFKKV